MNFFPLFKTRVAPDLEKAPLLPETSPNNDDILDIKQNLLHAKNLLAYIKEGPIQILDVEEERLLEQKKQQITLQITEILKQAKSDITNLSKYKSNGVANIQSSLFLELNKISKEFSTLQQQNLDKLNQTYSEPPVVHENYETMTDVQIQQIDLYSVEIETREKEIRQIATSVSEMAELMKDIATLVHSQGELLNNIEYQIEHAEEDVKQGVVEIKKAAATQKRGRVFYCILLLLVLFIVATILVLLKLFA